MTQIKSDYNLKMKKTLEENSKERSLLLHACCAPCACHPIELLKDRFKITLFFYNPNITDRAEYDKRLTELKNYISVRGYSIEIIAPAYDTQKFFEAIAGKEQEKEGQSRCFECYNLRLTQTAEFAKMHNFDYFSTVLTISPHKNSQKINQIGENLQRLANVNFLNCDFKKEGGFLNSLKIGKEYGLYRQDYCGCEFSRRLP